MGSFWQALGFGSSNQENDSDVPPSRWQPPDKDEKERIRKHVEKQEKELNDEDADDGGEPSGRLW